MHPFLKKYLKTYKFVVHCTLKEKRNGKNIVKFRLMLHLKDRFDY